MNTNPEEAKSDKPYELMINGKLYTISDRTPLCCEKLEETEDENVGLKWCVRLLSSERDELKRKLDRRSDDLAGWKARTSDAERRAEKAEAKIKALQEDAEEVVTNDDVIRAYRRGYVEATENRPTLDREAVRDTFLDWYNAAPSGRTIEQDHELLIDAIMALAPAEGWPEWLGPKIDPDDFEVTRDEEGCYRLECHTFAGKETTPDDLRNGWAGGGVRDKAKREAVARFIESEQAVTGDEDQRIEKAAEKLWLADRTGEVSWNELHVDMQCRYRDEAARLLDAGWTPPESESDQ